MPDLLQAVDPQRDHLRGEAGAPLQLVEYADFECPSCGEARAAVDEAREQLGDDLLVVFRHLPVPSSHPRSVAAALVAEAAAEQGAFWEMHDRLFDNQGSLERKELLGHAEELGLDVDRIAEALDEERASERIEEDVDVALRSGVSGTPAFFINGRTLTTGWGKGRLLEALQAAAADRDPSGGTDDE